MTAFPTYDGTALAALDRQASAILGCFAARGYAREEPAILQPAEIFLDRSGEEIRRRTFTLSDLSGRELCLRPDLTIPICRDAVARGAKFPARISYNGLVFRYQSSRRDRPTQFFQAGAELLGEENRARGEVEIMTLAIEALHATGLDAFEIKIGDLALFGAAVDALDVPAQWRARLKRHFWRGDYFDALLARLTNGEKKRTLPASRAAAEALIDAEADAPLAGRTREEIAGRAMEQAQAAAATHLDPAIAEFIKRLLAVSGEGGPALAEIRALAKGVGLNLDAPLEAMAARLDALKSLGLSRVRFAAHFGRNMEYYTGFVFELWGRDAEGPVQVAGGGRYDTLLESLGAGRAISAIGCAIRTERVLAALRFAGGA